MVTIGMNYRIKASKEEVFERAFQSVIEVMKGLEGHDRSHLYREVGEGPAEYLIVSRWESEEAFKGFIQSDQFRKVTNWGAENILEGPPRHTTYTEG